MTAPTTPSATTGERPAHPRPGRLAALRAGTFGLAVALADLTPPGVRYGYVHPLARRLLARPLPVLDAVPGAAFAPPSADGPPGPTDLRCGLLADHLDVGGVGRVVEMLAEGLRTAGVEPVVVCPGEGTRTARLRLLGYEVLVAADPTSARDALAAADLDVLQLHSAPATLVEAAVDTGAPLVPVLHNTEIHYQRPQWQVAADLFARAHTVVAVSEIVRQFHLVHLPEVPPERLVVVPNGAMPMPEADTGVRDLARAALAEVVGAPLDDDVVVVSLARYDSQKNVAGTVAAFLDAAGRSEVSVRLVVAGDPSDWLEHRRADALRRAHSAGDRVHLLGSSDAATLLAAGDAFVLDSFFEGWPLATTEAIAAGLPVVVSDTGGAAELIARAPAGSVLVANPTGPAAEVTDRTARAARRHARRQRNRDELSAALVDLTAALAAEPGRRERVRAADDSYDLMVDGHARIIRAAHATHTARTATPGPATR